MNLIVACPSCKTVFRMVREQLDASDGLVRCGHCMEVFNAVEQLAHRAVDQGSAEPSQYETLTPENLSFVQNAKKEQFWAHPQRRMLLLALCALMTILLLVQVLRTSQERLANLSPSLAGAAQTLCKVWPCTNKPARKISDWRIENSSFQKENGTTFRLTATLKNTSDAYLVIPHLELQLLDASDALLARRVIPIDAQQPDLMANGAFEKTYQWLITPSANDNIKLGIDNLVGYRLALFYP